MGADQRVRERGTRKFKATVTSSSPTRLRGKRWRPVALQALGKRAQAVAAPPENLGTIAAHPRKDEQLLRERVCAIWASTMAASPSNPFRMSVIPAAGQMRVPRSAVSRLAGMAIVAPRFMLPSQVDLPVAGSSGPFAALYFLRCR